VHNRLVTPRALANSICDQLIRSGFQALLAGGCVRDLLLGREPADYDVATDASPDQVMALFPESVAVGAEVWRDSDSARRPQSRSRNLPLRWQLLGRTPPRHCWFTLNLPKEDVQRRDFTINGLLMRHDTLEILDFVGGRADLNAGIIRAIGNPDRRFEEDKLRLLPRRPLCRAIRF